MDTLLALLDDTVRRGVAPGAVAGVTDRDGIRWIGAAGTAGAGAGEPMRTDAVFAIFSMTKAITSVVALQLVEEGRIALDQPLAELHPELADLAVLDGFDADGRPRLRPPATEPTLRHLLSHTSGFAYDVWYADLARWYQASGTPAFASMSLAGLRTPLVHDPGTNWTYGIGTDWLGRVLEHVTGSSLDRLFAERVFGPSGMTDTGFAATLPAATLGRKVGLAHRNADGELVATEVRRGTPEFHSGGGGLLSTAPDYLAFLRELLRGDTILPAGAVAAMGENQLGDVDLRVMRSSVAAISEDFEFLAGEPRGFGLGFALNLADRPGRRRAGSMAWAGLNNTFFWLDRTTGIGAVLMLQLLPFWDAGALALLDRFEAEVYRS